MRKKSMVTRLASLFLAAAVGITAMGCGTKEQPGSETGTQTSITEETPSDTGQEDSADNSGMGRYVESTVFEGEYWDRLDAQTLNDGQMVFVNSMTGRKFVSKDGGDTWEVEESDALAAFTDEHYPTSAAVSKDGTLALICMDLPEGAPEDSVDYTYNLYIYNTDDTSKQISIDLPDAESHLRELAFDDQGNLYVYAYGCKDIYKVDVNEGTAGKLTELQDSCGLMQCRDNILMCVSSDKLFLYDLEQKIFIEDETLDNFIEETYSDMSWTGAGYVSYPFLGADNTVYMAGGKGLYRHVIGGSAVEQVIDGGLSSLGAPSHIVMAMMENDHNEFVTAYSDGKFVKSKYDATVSTIPNDKITVYSLGDDDMVRQTIAAYQTQYPDFYIEYQIGMDEDSITREDALKKLNTQLLSGSGPDVIMLDGINIDTYAEKGVLMDLTDIVSEADQSEGLYMNLIESLKSDDKIYAVPTEFGIPVIIGRKDYVDNVSDFKSLADMVEKAREEYPDKSLLTVCSASGIMKRTAAICAPSWKDDKGQLDTQKIREYLEQAKRLYDVQMNGTPQEQIKIYQQRIAAEESGENYEDSKYFVMANDMNYLIKECPFVYGQVITAYNYQSMLSVPRVEGFDDTVFRPLNGQSSNVYQPLSIAAINTATKNPDAAKQFVRMMLSTTVQGTVEFGVPVNKKALAAKYEYDESELEENGAQSAIAFSDADGLAFGYNIFPVDQEGIDQLEKWIAALDTPYLSDTVLEDAVYTQGAKYLEGTQDIDAAVKAIADSVEIYLSE
ncbi:MAG: ABC transporter substrate-binding protein [Lachnospiraceae bacterium]|nr:ABC transporter substrate-binding protein [Lachnospiraceae bacterium]